MKKKKSSKPKPAGGYYSQFGLQEKRSDKEGEGERSGGLCLWCLDQKHPKPRSHRGISMCFAQFMICETCIEEAFQEMMREVHTRAWGTKECFRCKGKAVKTGWQPDPNGGFLLCEECIAFCADYIKRPPPPAPPPPPGFQFKLF